VTSTYQVKIKLQAFFENAVNLCPLPLKFKILEEGKHFKRRICSVKRWVNGQNIGEEI
jgi:hypothetical protein